MFYEQVVRVIACCKLTSLGRFRFIERSFFDELCIVGAACIRWSPSHPLSCIRRQMAPSNQIGASGSVNRTIDTRSAKQETICSVNDGVNF